MESSSEESPMNVDEMFLSLKILSQLKEFDKLISHPTLEIDNRHFCQGIRRWYDDESRDKTVDKIGEVFKYIFEYIDQIVQNERSNEGRDRELFDQNTSQLLQRFMVDIKNAIIGIENLRLTYRYDITISSKLQLLIDKLKIKTNRLNELLTISL